MSGQQVWRTRTAGAEETEQLGEAIGRRLRGGEVIELVSDLGGGKTTFVRGLARGIGSPDHVASPTFTISNVYKGVVGGGPESVRLDEVQGAGEQRAEPYTKYGEGAAEPATQQFAKSGGSVSGSARKQDAAAQTIWLYHFDFYRLHEAGIVADALNEAAHDPEAVVVVEWGDIVSDVFPAERLTVTIKALSEQERELVFSYSPPLAHVLPEGAHR